MAAALVVKHEESGVHRLSDTVGKGEVEVYRAPNMTAAHNYLHMVSSSRAFSVKVGKPAVNGRGMGIRTPLDKEETSR